MPHADTIPDPSAAPAPASRLVVVLLISFLESFATILLERGVYFYSKDILHFTKSQNLGLGLVIGTGYVIGASMSHRLSARLGEKKLLLIVLFLQMASHLLLAQFRTVTPFLIINFALSVWTGAKWPIMESYVSAGRGLKETSRVIGMFNISWASAAPPSLFAAGYLIDDPHLTARFGPGIALFLVAAVINILDMGLVTFLPSQPAHRPVEKRGQEDTAKVESYQKLLTSSRFSMTAGYTLLFLMVPLLPSIFCDQLGFQVGFATQLASIVEAVRMAMFILLFTGAYWHGTKSPLLVSAVALPISFFLVIFAGDVAKFFPVHEQWTAHLSLVLFGLTVFGLAAGMVYYAALYYAMVLSNASVDAGGTHESLIGAGFAVGPALGLLGLQLAGPLGGPIPGMLVGVAPLALLGLVLSVRPLISTKTAA